MRLPRSESAATAVTILAATGAVFLWVGARIWLAIPEPRQANFGTAAISEAMRGSVELPWLIASLLGIWVIWLHKECSRLEPLSYARSQAIRDEFEIDARQGFARHPKKPDHIFCMRCLHSEPPRQTPLVCASTTGLYHCVHPECHDMADIKVRKEVEITPRSVKPPPPEDQHTMSALHVKVLLATYRLKDSVNTADVARATGLPKEESDAILAELYAMGYCSSTSMGDRRWYPASPKGKAYLEQHKQI